MALFAIIIIKNGTLVNSLHNYVQKDTSFFAIVDYLLLALFGIDDLRISDDSF